MKNPNGYGTIIKLSGNRRRPYACRKTVGFNDRGYPIYKYISYHKTRREAVQALAEYNRDPYSLEKLTFAQAYDKWIEVKKPSETSRKAYTTAFNHLSEFYNISVSDLTLKRLQLYFDELETTQSTLDKIDVVLHGVFDYCIKRGLIPVSSKEILSLVEMIPRKESRKVDRKIFTAKEIDFLWNHKEDDTARILLFYIYTGLRYSELANLKPEDIKNEYLSIKKSKTASGVRDVPLSDKAKSLLPLPKIPGNDSLILATRKLGLYHTIHDTRHTFISLLTVAGVDERIIKKIVGHSSNSITQQIYTHISMDVMIEAVNRI